MLNNAHNTTPACSLVKLFVSFSLSSDRLRAKIPIVVDRVQQRYYTADEGLISKLFIEVVSGSLGLKWKIRIDFVVCFTHSRLFCYNFFFFFSAVKISFERSACIARFYGRGYYYCKRLLRRQWCETKSETKSGTLRRSDFEFSMKFYASEKP